MRLPSRRNAPSHPEATGLERTLCIVEAAALAFLLGCVLAVAAGPIVTDDLWWHLAMGATYAAEGPWPDGDPLLHTAHADAPVQHEWLFGVALHAVHRVAGFHGLRVLHGLAVLGITGLVAWLFRREAGRHAAAFGLAFFLAVAWWRLFQLRPDLASIPAAFAVYALLLAPERPPSGARIAAFAALLAVWANLHSLFAVGLLLTAAGLAGSLAHLALARRAGGATPEDALWPRRLGLALLAGTLASLLNPRGAAQHLTFVTSTRESGIWRVHDEWTRFDPFSPAYTSDAVGLLSWAATDALLLAFALCAAALAVRLLRSPSRPALDAAGLRRMAVAAAACVALLASIRFLWMGVLPLLFVLRAAREAGRPPAGARRAALALGTAVLAAGFVPGTAWRQAWGLFPGGPAERIVTPYAGSKYAVQGVRFLRDTGLEGNLFNKYPSGGFLGYWLAPRLRTFVDSRTEHYSAEVLAEYSAVNVARGARPGETFLDVLDRRGVDVFFGTGPPTGVWRDAVLYTAEHLRGVPGWALVSRSPLHAIYLRRGPPGSRRAANLERVAAWYAAQGVPFDPQDGLDPAAVLRRRPDWAEAHGMAPPGYTALRGAAAAGDPDALEIEARTLALLGAYEAQLERDDVLRVARPADRGVRRRRVHALLRLGRHREALGEARSLVALDPQDPLSRSALRIAAQAVRELDDDPLTPDAQALLMRFPLLDPEGADWVRRAFGRATLDAASPPGPGPG